LRHIREVGFLCPPQVDAFEFYVEYYDSWKVVGDAITQTFYLNSKIMVGQWWLK
jgi:hypothetical protein